MPYFDYIIALCEVRSFSSSDQGWGHAPVMKGFQAFLTQNLHGDEPLTMSFYQRGDMSALRTSVRDQGRRTDNCLDLVYKSMEQ